MDVFSAKWGTDNYYRIEVLPSSEFVKCRNHDIGDLDCIQRVAGQRRNGSWTIQAWLVSKDCANLVRNKLVPTTDETKRLFNSFKSKPVHIKENLYRV